MKPPNLFCTFILFGLVALRADEVTYWNSWRPAPRSPLGKARPCRHARMRLCTLPFTTR